MALLSRSGGQLGLQASEQASSSGSPPPIACNGIFRKPPTQVNESLWEVHSPEGDPAMQIYFFHGLQFGEASEDDFWTTWQNGDGSCIWPEAWLGDDFPKSQIFFVSYNASVDNRRSSIDMYQITENLAHEFVNQPRIGRGSSCPIILVGHCFGGLVIKSLCLAIKKRGTLKASEREKVKVEAFLDNIKGIFYYDTPHHGIPDLHKLTDARQNPLWSYFQSLSNDIERLNFEFRLLHQSYTNWRIRGLGASLPTTLGLSDHVVIVTESSGREGDDFNVVDGVDHYTICKPRSKITKSFWALKFLVREIAIDYEEMGQQCHGLPLYSSGVKERAYKVEELCMSGMVVGIVGMGGIGKTTTAKQVFNNMSREFEYTCFADDVKSIPLYQLENLLCQQFHHNGTRIGGNGISWAVLKGRKTLIVMDDVDSETQLKKLPHLEHFGSGSCLIITTRDRGVLRMYRQHTIYDVELLTDEEAETLFCQYAFPKEGFRSVGPGAHSKSTHLESNIRRVVEKCQGLPLTLELMGCYLRGHDGEYKFWNQTIERLGRACAIDGGENDRLFASLRMSVDALTVIEREMFIEASTYFYPVSRGWNQPSWFRYGRAFAAWSTAHESDIPAWRNLLSRSLVKEHEIEDMDGLKYKEIWVHEHLRDLAKTLEHFHVVREGPGPVEEALDLLVSNEMRKETTVLNLEVPKSCSPFQFRLWKHDSIRDRHSGHETQNFLQLSSLEKLNNLKYLTLLGVRHKGTSIKLPNKISLLRWKGDNSDLPISLEGMKNLAIVHLSNWKVTQLRFSSSLGRLVKLRIALLDNLAGLDSLPEKFGYLSCLEVLELKSLGLSKLPSSFGNLSALQILSITTSAILELPESFGNLSSLVTLEIASCRKLATLPESFGNLSSLVRLQISGCENLAAFPESFGNLSSLVRLQIFHCEKFATLPESFGNLSSLVTLEIRDCEKLATLPESFGNLSSLVTLDFFKCEKLATLPESFGNLSSLVTLTFFKCEKLATLPESFGNLSSLVTFEIDICRKFVKFPVNFGQLNSLKKVTLGIKSLFPRTEEEKFEYRSEAMISPLLSLRLLPSLHELKVQTDLVTQLPEVLGEFASLQTLRIRCRNPKMLPNSIGDLPCLERLCLDMQSFQSLPESIKRLHSLSSLTIILKTGKSLPEELGNLTTLKTLSIQNCRELETLPNSLGRIPALREVQIIKCHRLRTLPNSLRRFVSPQVAPSGENTAKNQGQSSPTAATEEIKLTILLCEGLDDSVLERLDWERRGSRQWYPRKSE